MQRTEGTTGDDGERRTLGGPGLTRLELDGFVGRESGGAAPAASPLATRLTAGTCRVRGARVSVAPALPAAMRVDSVPVRCVL